MCLRARVGHRYRQDRNGRARHQEIHAYIREVLAAKFGAAAQETAILYGGSCKPSNAAEIFAKEDVDGGLIGGASLKAPDFAAIVEAASK